MVYLVIHEIRKKNYLNINQLNIFVIEFFSTVKKKLTLISIYSNNY